MEFNSLAIGNGSGFLALEQIGYNFILIFGFKQPGEVLDQPREGLEPLVVGLAVGHSQIDVLQEIRQQQNIAVLLDHRVSLHEKCIEFASLVIPRQNFMLQLVAVPMAQVDSLLQHLEKHVGATSRQRVARENIGDCF